MSNSPNAFELLKKKLSHLLPEFEIREKAKLVEEINALKKKKNAVILGHNYMEPALFHGVSDFTGDSLELCRQAEKAECERIVFCGVEFMAETAKIINPEKKVLLPSKKAGCSLASSISADDVRALKKRYPGVPVVSYINTYADVKAETDVCCTSGNAAHIVSQLPSDQVIFIPDEYLARNVAKETGKEIIFPDLSAPKEALPSDKLFISWPGKCEVHEQFTLLDIQRARAQVQDVIVLAHPECPPEVVAASDFSGSTSAMIRYVKENPAAQYLLLTECAMADNIIADAPEGEVLRLCSIRCPHMAQITLEDTLEALVEDRYEIQLDAFMMDRARDSITRMLQMSSN